MTEEQPTQIVDLATFVRQWEFEFNAWRDTFHGQTPFRLVATKNFSGGYEQDKFHVFELPDHSFAFVSEQGCSCYEPADASITIYASEADAMHRFKNEVAEAHPDAVDAYPPWLT